ncbi:MAG: ChbG/HpnK family deacetylase, partial [Oscillospiraceae bacterium]|nr:ChbG/HpnK family deacetylase [Oscillospiraceae bacterium]
MEKYLIINADDYGSFLGANLATQELLQKGCITSSTVMLPCPWAKHACQWAAAHPEFSVGVHLTTTSEWNDYRWGPVTDGRSLRDEEGYFWHEVD